jgi:transposase
MSSIHWPVEREKAIHLLRSGLSVKEVAQALGRSESWVRKWRKRFEEESWAGLQGRSRAPKHIANRYPEEVRRAIRLIRSQLEAQAAKGEGLGYIGAPAIRARLREDLERVPSISTIERVLHQAGMTHPRKPKPHDEVHYPALSPTQPHELLQVDIVPHHLEGGQSVACFNSIDVVSRYPAGQAYATKRAQDAQEALLGIWLESGIPKYTQVDNEACFSGGFVHPGVLGQVVRLALMVGTQLVFSPFGRPESNGHVERFHQDYNQHVWEKNHLDDLAAVRRTSQRFYRQYRHSRHIRALAGCTPAEMHSRGAFFPFPEGFRLPEGRLPLTEGKVHFIRQVDARRQVRILNLDWDVSQAEPEQGVWAELEITEQEATLAIYDAAPDAAQRRRLAEHPFPLKEPVQPLAPMFRRQQAVTWPGLMGLGLQYLKARYDVLKADALVKVLSSATMS